MKPTQKSWLVETDKLNEQLGDPHLVVFDATWYIPSVNANARQQYLDEHIPNALFFDIDDICDISTKLPHMLPNPIKFSAKMRRLGVGDGMQIVVYDHLDLFSAARAWWMFRAMGVENVSVLNGGMRKWTDEDRPVDEYPHRPRIERHFTARINHEIIATLDEVKDAVKTGSAQIVDARPYERFTGEEKEPRPGVRPGHIPQSISVPRKSLLNSDGTMKDNEGIRDVFAAAGVDLARPIITTCGSGITAAVPFLALSQIGHEGHSLYDGSWAEWGSESGLPVATGSGAKA